MKDKTTTDHSVPEELGEENLYKRPFDLTLLVLVHLVLFPVGALLWMLIPLLIWLEDRGPIFYVQERVGLNGRTFGLLKFRTMRMARENEAWSGFTTRNDPRVTRVGRLLRRFALDEIPSAVNIWKGDISLVGPRPLPTDMHNGYVKEEPNFLLRLRVRPGLTGPAQVYAPRHTNAQERLLYDLPYVQHASLWLDLKLIVLSIWLTLTGQRGRERR